MNNYVIYESLGKSEFTEVQKGRKKKSTEFVILKSFAKSQKDRMFNEVNILKTLKHDNVIAVNYWYETRNHFWTIYEYVGGSDLRRVVDREAGVVEEYLQIIASQLVDGLAYIHAQKVIFCDMKPSNMVFNEFSVLKYVDFASARFEAELANPTTSSPLYAAPEVLASDRYSYKSDVFGLGVVLYELARGVRPYASTGGNELLAEMQSKRPARIEKYSDAFNALLERMLDPNAESRLSLKDVENSPWMRRATIKLKGADLTKSVSSALDEKEVNLSKSDQHKRQSYLEETSKNSLMSIASISANDKYKVERSNSTFDKKKPSPPTNRSEKDKATRSMTPNILEAKVLQRQETGDQTTQSAGPTTQVFDRKNSKSPNISQINEGENNPSGDEESGEENNSKVASENVPFKHSSGFHCLLPRDVILFAPEKPQTDILFNSEIEHFDTADIQGSQINIPSDTDISKNEIAKDLLTKAYNFIQQDVSKIPQKTELLENMYKHFQVKNFANLIMESGFFEGLLKQAQITKIKPYKVALITAIGLVLKTTDKVQYGKKASVFFETLQEAYSVPSEVIKARSVAVIGTFVTRFLVGSEQKADQEVLDACFALFMRILSSTKDELTLCYVLKTLEVATVLSPSVVAKLATPEMVVYLLTLFKIKSFKRHLYLKRLILNIFSQLLRSANNIRPMLMDSDLVEQLKLLFRSENSKFVAALLLYLANFFCEFSDGFAQAFYKNFAQVTVKIMEWFVRGDPLIQLRIINFLTCLFATNIVFIADMPDFLKYLSMVKRTKERFEGAEAQKKKAQSDQLMVALSLHLETLRACNRKMLQEFCEGVQKQKLAENPRYFLFCISMPIELLKKEIVSEQNFDADFVIALLSVSFKCDSLHDVDNQEIALMYQEYITLLLECTNLKVKLEQQILVKVITPLVLSITTQKKEEILANQFRILISLFNISCPTEGNEGWKPIAKKIFEFCSSLLLVDDAEWNINALKVSRQLIEKNLIQMSDINPSALIRTLVDMLAPLRNKAKADLDPQDVSTPYQIWVQIFAIFYLMIIGNSKLINDIQKYSIFEKGVQFLLDFKSCQQFDELLSFFHCFLDLSHQRAKNNTNDFKIVFNGKVLTHLLSFLSHNIENFMDYYIEEIISIMYYGLKVIADAKTSQVIQISPPVSFEEINLKNVLSIKPQTDMEKTKKRFKKLDALFKAAAK